MIASAFLALLLLYSCHKERLGQYEPKKKISKIYRSNEKTEVFAIVKEASNEEFAGNCNITSEQDQSKSEQNCDISKVN